ncbi:uncharacterized protein LOC143445575 isoform X1 [Clavelina lepadiformis]|uniref:uncharacterized protein LOC143445575 isoform X1 n=1 Tax=Clavelina lepadiformis TaxID=159417 RepID=UPI0040414A41
MLIVRIRIFIVVVLLLVTDVVQGRSTDEVQNFLDAAAKVSNMITSVIPSWHTYDYDGEDDFSIRDGGIDMFDVGNKKFANYVFFLLFILTNLMQIRMFIDQERVFRYLTYNDTYRFPGFEYGTLAIQPFFALAWIRNSRRRTHSYTMSVTGEAGADGRGRIDLQNGTFSMKGISTSYQVFQISNAGDPSIVNLHFYMKSSSLWKSKPGSFELVDFSSTTEYANSTVRLSGRPRNVLMGYVLLSRRPEDLLDSSLVKQVLTILINDFAQLGPIYPVPRRNCGQLKLVADECEKKVLESPNYPHPTDFDCIWKIKAPKGYYVQFEFTDVESNKLLKLYERPLSTLNISNINHNLFYLRGPLYPSLLSTRSNKVFVEYHEPTTGFNKRFRLTYQAKIATDIISLHLEAFQGFSARIRNAVPDWFNYNYDDYTPPINTIFDSGIGHFPFLKNGNKIQFSIDREDSNAHIATYNDIYRSSLVEIGTTTNHPFTALMWIKNHDKEAHEYYLKVSGAYAVADVFDSTTFSSSLSGSGLKIDYTVHELCYNDKRVIEVFFYVESETLWNSEPGSFEDVSLSNVGSVYNHLVRVTGRPKNVLLGYMLLGRRSEFATPTTVFKEVIKIVLAGIPLSLTRAKSKRTPEKCKEAETCKPLLSTALLNRLSFLCTNENNIGSLCYLYCSSGLNLRGDAVVRCQNNGKWTATLALTKCVSVPNGLCLPGKIKVNCPVRPCGAASCPGLPAAKCMDDYCGGCFAMFIDSFGNRLSDEDCDPNRCPPGVKPVKCVVPPCNVASCPTWPDATCTNDNCGDCRAIFTDSVGNVLSMQQCNAFPGCSSPVQSKVLLSYALSCTYPDYRVGTSCYATCPNGTTRRGTGSIICQRRGFSYSWSGSFASTRCGVCLYPPFFC